MIERHLMMLRSRDALSPEEEAAIRDGVSEPKTYAADTTVIRAGDELHYSTLLLEGLMCRYKDLSQGQRQITQLHVPGDFVDLHSFTLKRLEHNIMTLTRCRVVLMPHAKLKAITERFPHLTRLYWFSTNVDAAVHREWELSLGRRSAAARVANLLCELHARLEIVGLTQGDSYDLQLTQTDLAECLGLTAVHVNRTLKELRLQGLAEVKRGRVTILDMGGLMRVAEFDPRYLYLGRRAH